MGSEAAGFEEATNDVVGQAPEAQGDTAKVLEAAVEGPGGSVAGAGPVEVGGVSPARLRIVVASLCSSGNKSLGTPWSFPRRSPKIAFARAGFSGGRSPGAAGMSPT